MSWSRKTLFKVRGKSVNCLSSLREILRYSKSQQKVTIREFYFTCWPLGLRKRLLVDKGNVVSKSSCEGIAIFLLISAAENLFPSHSVATLCNDCVAGITALMCK